MRRDPALNNVFIRYIAQALQQEGAFLLPLRLFIGIGWFRAGLEKWLNPGWHDGSSLASFLNAHVQNGLIEFSGYQQWVQTIFEPHSFYLGFIIMVSQLLIGIAIMTGTFTNLALLGGLVMNINFILVGEVNPSAFYVMIQVVLLISNIGAIMGLDQFLSRGISCCFIVAKPSSQKTLSLLEKSFMVLAMITSVAAAIAVVPSIKSYDPSSVHDPAMISLVLSLFSAAFFLITFLRSELSLMPQLNGMSTMKPHSLEFSQSNLSLKMSSVDLSPYATRSTLTGQTLSRSTHAEHSR